MKDAGPCCRCKTPIWMEDGLYDAARRSPKISFWCPFGHEQHFAEGDTEETKLRRERDRLLQQTARLEDEKREQRQRADKAEAAAKRLKKRIAAGVCPCCKRTVHALAAHMKVKHPEFVVENVVPLRAKA